MKCPSCKASVSHSDFRNDPWSKFDKYGDGYYCCPSCGEKLVHRFRHPYLLGTYVLGPLLAIAAWAAAEFTALVGRSLISAIVTLEATGEEVVTFVSYVLVLGIFVTYTTRLKKLELN